MGKVLSAALNDYIDAHTSPQSQVLSELERHTHLHHMLPQMLSGNVQGKFLSLFTQLIQPKHILEIGTYTGYATICFAQALPENGKIITLDINEELETTARNYFEKASVTDKIEFKIGNALNIIPTLDVTLDMVFIDADKVNYSKYYDLVFPKLKMGGYILADNVLWGGDVVSNEINTSGKALMAFNEKVNNDDRVENIILSIRDGIMLAKKIKE